jgi:hypothetical protein
MAFWMDRGTAFVAAMRFDENHGSTDASIEVLTPHIRPEAFADRSTQV